MDDGTAIKQILMIQLLLFTMIVSHTSCTKSVKKEEQKPIEWFQDARFGIFIHYDPSAVYGDIHENAGIEIGQERFPHDQYVDIYKQFNPVNFDAGEWVGIFKKAGARYVAFTTKHSYGLHMWDNPLFDKDIMATPFKRDICKELSEELHKQNIKLFWYYNSYDRLYPNFLEEREDSLSPYYEFRQKSIEQLLTNYGDVTGIWWDGSPPHNNKELVDYVKSINPDILMTGRLGIKGDYSTPEQIIGAFEIENPWESCYAIEGINWMWAGGKDVKDVPTCIKTLINCAVGGGNLLLNISPMPDGNIQPEQVTSLLGMGEWLDKYGESIYETRGGPYKPGTWGGSTRKGNKVYLHITQQIEDGRLELPDLPSKIIKYKLLTEGKVSIVQEKRIIISLDSEAAFPEVCTVIELELEQSAMDIPPVSTGYGEKSLAADVKVTASSQKFPNTPPEAVIYHSELEDKTKDYRVLIRCQNRNLPIPPELQNLPAWGFTPRERGFRLRYWRAGDEDTRPVLEFDMGRPVIFSQVQIMEKFNRIRAFELQYLMDGKWITFYKGNRLNYFSLKHEPISAQRVRLLITKTEEGAAAIKMFDLY
jgi:alpha-L-fucosidase